MTDGIDDGALDEAWTEGRRLLGIQERVQQAEFARVAEMLRLNVAAIGAVIVVVGIMAANGLRLTPGTLVLAAAGVAGLVASAFMLASIIAHSGRAFGLAYGPDMDTIVKHLTRGRPDRRAILLAFVIGVPESMAANDAVIVAVQQRKARAFDLAHGVRFHPAPCACF